MPNPAVAFAVAAGLVIGKPLGITLGAFAAVALRLGALPRRVTWLQLHGCAWLGGIGFTMSLFIAALAFDTDALRDPAKIGILAGSLLAGVVAGLVLRTAARAAARAPHAG
jgi:NhaA family Na+:H+ antiporter